MSACGEVLKILWRFWIRKGMLKETAHVPLWPHSGWDKYDLFSVRWKTQSYIANIKEFIFPCMLYSFWLGHSIFSAVFTTFICSFLEDILNRVQAFFAPQLCERRGADECHYYSSAEAGCSFRCALFLCHIVLVRQTQVCLAETKLKYRSVIIGQS